MRRAAKRDTPETEIVKALRSAGCLVMCGSPNPDLIVQRGLQTHLLEVKRRTGRLTETQEKLIAAGWNIKVVRNIDEAFEAVGLGETR